MNTASKQSAKGGFTLVEVSLAVLVVGLGLLTLFGLFPSGLRAGEEAAADTRAGFFASVVMGGIRANAAEIKTWTEWSNDAAMLGANSRLCASLDGVGTLIADGTQQPMIEFPTGSPLQYRKYLRYSLDIRRPGGATSRRCSAYLRVWERTGNLYNEFYTEFMFGGR